MSIFTFTYESTVTIEVLVLSVGLQTPLQHCLSHVFLIPGRTVGRLQKRRDRCNSVLLVHWPGKSCFFVFWFPQVGTLASWCVTLHVLVHNLLHFHQPLSFINTFNWQHVLSRWPVVCQGLYGGKLALFMLTDYINRKMNYNGLALWLTSPSWWSRC